MKPSEIKVGKTYVNRGAGRTKRVVLAIGDEHRPKVYWNATGKHPDDTGVLYRQIGGQFDGKTFNLYLKSFAGWAKKEV